MIFLGCAMLGVFSINAQGAFKVGANIGLPLSSTSEAASLNVGVDVAYLYEIIDNLEIGGLIGYVQFFADGEYIFVTNSGNIIMTDYKDASFVPISSTARYYFSEGKFFGGLDLGFAINVSGDADSGLFFRPKFGFIIGPVAIVGSYQGISGGAIYNSNLNSNLATVSGFNSVNVGVEFGF